MSARAAVIPTAIPLDVLAAFGLAGPSTPVAIAGGHINRTWRVDHVAGSTVLQWINGGVFPNPEQLVRNTAAVTRHVRARSMLVPEQLNALDGAPFVRDAAGEIWRATAHVPETRTLFALGGRVQAHAAGAGFGRFLRLTQDFNVHAFEPAIHGFHDLLPRLAAFDAACRSDAHARAAVMPDVLTAIESHRQSLSQLPFAALPARLIHGDCKLSNLLLHATRDEVVAVIDLDTVMASTLLFDFGDLVRSACARAPEDEPDVARVAIDSAWFAAIAHGFVTELGHPLLAQERNLLVPACAYIAFMLGVRFATDFLCGDTYFRTTRRNQNLDRARTQLRMAELYLQQRTELERLLEP